MARTRSAVASRLAPGAWRTVRVRLSALFGAGFLVMGAGLLAIANVLVQHTAADAVYSAPAAPDSGLPRTAAPGTTFIRSLPAAPADLAIQAQLSSLHASDVHQFLVRSGIALATAVLAAFALGFFVAGRVLRPVRDITAKAKAISAHNLHERLTLGGPADELRELGDTFDALLERLEQAFRAQRRFIANASHELRGPLTRQLTLAEVALGDPEPSVESLRAAHERVVAAARLQERIIDALLTLARGQAGTERREPVDLATMAERVVGTAHSGLPDIGVRTDLRHAPITGDPQLVERLFTNLVDNAVRYNTTDGWVEVRTGVRGGRAVLSVRNSGPVIPADLTPQLTEPFRRLASDRTGFGRKGFGLGLSIVEGVAEAHGAELTIRPRDGGGLEIDVAFPSPSRQRLPDSEP